MPFNQGRHPTIFGRRVRLQVQVDDGTWIGVPCGLRLDTAERELRVEIGHVLDVIRTWQISNYTPDDPRP